MNKSNKIQEPTFLSNMNLFYRIAMLEEKQRQVSAHYKANNKDNSNQDEIDIKYGYTSRRSR